MKREDDEEEEEEGEEGRSQAFLNKYIPGAAGAGRRYLQGGILVPVSSLSLSLSLSLSHKVKFYKILRKKRVQQGVLFIRFMSMEFLAGTRL